VLPPKSKRVKVAELEKASTQYHEAPVVKPEAPNIVITLRAADTNSPLGGKLFLPADTTPMQLSQIVNKLLGTVRLALPAWLNCHFSEENLTSPGRQSDPVQLCRPNL